jgi:hypothetical protein
MQPGTLLAHCVANDGVHHRLILSLEMLLERDAVTVQLREIGMFV